MTRPRKLSDIRYGPYKDEAIKYTSEPNKMSMRKALQPKPDPKTQMTLRWHINHLICMLRGHVYSEEYELADWHWSSCLRCQHTKPTK